MGEKVPGKEKKSRHRECHGPTVYFPNLITGRLFYIQFHQSLEDKKENIVRLKTELAWSMAKQAEVEFSKASKEIDQQEHKNYT